MSGKFERALSLVLAVSAVVFVGILMRRELIGNPPLSDFADQSKPPEFVSNWEELKSNSVQIWAPTATVTVLEFADLECPACKQFHARLKEAVASMHENVGLLFVHYPLSIHRFAKQASRALECAARTGRSANFVDIAYAKQDSFGLKPWQALAREAGVVDTLAFGACVADTTDVPRLQKGRLLGESLTIHGTPAVIINGWRFYHVPQGAELRDAILALRAGKPPPGAHVPRKKI
jgi:protein-disulfide isomerase